VQREIELVAQRVVGRPVSLTAASRTDAGVHARGQVANLISPATLPVENLRRAIGGRLPADVALYHAAEVAPDFHAGRDAIGKLYRYRIHNATARPVAGLAAPYAWHVWVPLDLDRMRAAAALMVGTHDFAGFASKGSPRESTVRTISQIGIRTLYQDVLIDVAGDGFLYNQVRNMVGTLYEIGRGHWPPQRVQEIIASCDRANAGPTAPPHGLCLQWVRYRHHRDQVDAA
jgi:tRNA pseudouridine38-40 synthase